MDIFRFDFVTKCIVYICTHIDNYKSMCQNVHFYFQRFTRFPNSALGSCQYYFSFLHGPFLLSSLVNLFVAFKIDETSLKHVHITRPCEFDYFAIGHQYISFNFAGVSLIASKLMPGPCENFN